MKKTFSRIVSIILATLVLFSTFSFTVEKHYCMGQLADYSLVGNVDRCQMPGDATNGHSKETELKKIPCCDDVIEVIEGTNAELKMAKELSLDKIQFVVAFVASYINLFEGLPENIIPFNNHSPPLLSKDIQVLHQIFLI